MKKTVIKEAFYENFAPLLAAQGFSKPLSKDIFTRKREGRKDGFQLIWLDAKEGYFVCPDAGIRIEKVEAIFHETSGFQSKYQRGTSTVGAPLGTILGGTMEDCAFLIKTEDDIASAVNGAAKAFVDIASPYYDRWSTIEAIDAGINDNPSEDVSYLRGTRWFRCSTGVIVARIMRRENYDAVVNFYTDIMARDNQGFYLKRFQALVDSLKSKI